MASAPAAVRQGSPAAAGYRRLLVPITGSIEAERAMQTACVLAAEHGASVAAVFVIEISPLLPLDAEMTDEEAAGRDALARAEAIADAYGLRVHARTVRTRDAGRAIVDLVEDEGTELIVVGAPRAQHGYRRSPAFGATVRHVLAKAPCRVMLLADPA